MLKTKNATTSMDFWARLAICMFRYNLTMTKLPAYRQVLFHASRLFLISLVVAVQIITLSVGNNAIALDLNNSDEIAKEIEKLSKDLKASQDATVPLEQKLKSLTGQITSIQTKLNNPPLKNISINIELPHLVRLFLT